MFIFPLLGLIFSVLAIIFGIISLVKISNNKETLKGKGLAIAGISLGAFGIILVPIFAILAAIAIPHLMRAKLSANDALAKSTLRVMATASETYAADHKGAFPQDASDLLTGNPPYLTTAYCGQEISGFVYSCSFSPSGYPFETEPVQWGGSGSTSFMITTGGVMTPPAQTQAAGY